MKRDFSWDSVAGHVTEAYEWLLERGDRPTSVQLGEGALTQPSFDLWRS